LASSIAGGATSTSVSAGQSQGGISTPKAAPLIFLFTGDAGDAYGYEDSFRPDGTFWYTGEGQVGDMQMVRGNAAIAGHHEAGKHLLLFENTQKDRVRYLGEFEYLDHHVEQRADRKDALRNALIFHLGLMTPIVLGEGASPAKARPAAASLPRKFSLADLRRLALEGVSSGSPVMERRANVALRAQPRFDATPFHVPRAPARHAKPMPLSRRKRVRSSKSITSSGSRTAVPIIPLM